jgi:hypothetical protein
MWRAWEKWDKILLSAKINRSHGIRGTGKADVPQDMRGGGGPGGRSIIGNL